MSEAKPKAKGASKKVEAKDPDVIEVDTNTEEIKEIKEPQVKPEPNRVFANQMTIASDLFKLEPANMSKNTSWNDKAPILIPVEHCHFFRTYDSNGKRMDVCNHVGGHSHKVTVTVNRSGDLIAECSPAINTKFNDSHTHAVTYLRSDKVQRRVMNKEATEVIASFQSYK